MPVPKQASVWNIRKEYILLWLKKQAVMQLPEQTGKSDSIS
jgi:hypothetical protein